MHDRDNDFRSFCDPDFETIEHSFSPFEIVLLAIISIACVAAGFICFAAKVGL